MKRFELSFEDLTKVAQERILKAAGIEKPEDLNWDIPGFPLAIIEFEEDI